MGQQPAFPLGHGLSYTTFAYGPLRVLPAFHRGGGRQSPRPEHRRPRGRRSRPALRRLAGEPPKGPQGVSQTRSRPALDRDADAGPAGPVGEGRPRPHQHMGQPRRPLPADGRQLITRPPLDLDLRAPELKPSQLQRSGELVADLGPRLDHHRGGDVDSRFRRPLVAAQLVMLRAELGQRALKSALAGVYGCTSKRPPRSPWRLSPGLVRGQQVEAQRRPAIRVRPGVAGNHAQPGSGREVDRVGARH